MSNNISVFGPEYPKINTIFKRDPKIHLIIPSEFAEPEFEYLQNNMWLWTEKVDGTNIRLHFDGNVVHVGGRTDNAQIPTCLLEVLEPLTNANLWKGVFGDDTKDVTIHGEGFGPKIQKGGHYQDFHEFIVFDVRIGRWWLKFEDVQGIARKFNLRSVPAFAYMTLKDLVNTMYDGGLGSMWPGAKLEGFVGHPAIELHARNGGRITAKIKVRDFEELRCYNAGTTGY